MTTGNGGRRTAGRRPGAAALHRAASVIVRAILGEHGLRVFRRVWK